MSRLRQTTFLPSPRRLRRTEADLLLAQCPSLFSNNNTLFWFSLCVFVWGLRSYDSSHLSIRDSPLPSPIDDGVESFIGLNAVLPRCHFSFLLSGLFDHYCPEVRIECHCCCRRSLDLFASLDLLPSGC